jgi:putative transposase
MPRRARIMLPGVPVHVVHRGNNRQACFYESQDRSFYLFHLRRLLAATGCGLHAYCLMTNHVHLLLTSSTDGGCARLMQRVAQLFTQYANRTYQRSGSLWEGRFRSCLVQSEEYLLACYRYVEANPVRAGLCQQASDHEWSSYRGNADGIPDALLTPHEEYLRLGVTGATRCRAYQDLFRTDARYWRTDEIRKATNGNFALGDDNFKRQLAARLGRRVECGRAGRPKQRPHAHAGQLELVPAG